VYTLFVPFHPSTLYPIITSPLLPVPLPPTLQSLFYNFVEKKKHKR
jgi:hypothetical protein